MIKSKFVAALMAASMLFNLATPAFAQMVLVIDGNGAGSNNDVDVDATSSNTVSQTNDLNVLNEINVVSDTGNNDANRNTGGDVEIDTGSSDISQTTLNQGGINTAAFDGCNCLFDGVEIIASGNGADSTNNVVCPAGCPT